MGLGILALVAGLGFGARQESKQTVNIVPLNQSLPTKASLKGHNIQSLEETQVQPPSGPPLKAVVIQGCLDADDEWQIPVHAGQNYVVQASRDATCNGWTSVTNVGIHGPEGEHGSGNGEVIGGPTIDHSSRIASLIASVSDFG